MVKMLRIDDDVHADLTDLGKKNESYSNVIRRLIEFYKDKSTKDVGSSSKSVKK